MFRLAVLTRFLMIAAVNVIAIQGKLFEVVCEFKQAFVRIFLVLLIHLHESLQLL